MAETITINTIYLKSNRGLGNALRIALQNCRNELVARMDSDDISQTCRFEMQLDYLKKHPEVDIVGGNIIEFIGEETNITGQRRVPETDEEIKKYMKKRCAFNHMAVMYKKTAVKKAGGYREWFYNEDYYLWIRMMLTGAIFANVQDNIVKVRVGNEMCARRGGMQYFKSEKKLQTYMLHKGIIDYPLYFYNTAIRFVGEAVLPNSLRAKLYRFTRKPVKKTLTKENKPKKPFKRKKSVSEMNEASSISYPPFSVAMSVYGKDNPQWFDRAMESLVNQTVKPDEIVLVVDGPVPPEIDAVIEKYTAIFSAGGGELVLIKYVAINYWRIKL